MNVKPGFARHRRRPQLSAPTTLMPPTPSQYGVASRTALAAYVARRCLAAT
jgi:hypothetical protein